METLELGHSHHNIAPNNTIEKREKTIQSHGHFVAELLSQSYHKVCFHSGSLSTLNRLLLLVWLLTMQNGGMESASFGAIFRGLEEVLSELGAAAES